jgi:shikimate kinase
MIQKEKKVKNFKDRKIIVLLGMMGAGKTTVGLRLAEKLGIAFIDSDKEIENITGKNINKIFANLGEVFFRTKEREVIAQIISQDQALVLAIGGGAFTDDATRQLLQENCVCVWLNPDLETILKRVAHKSHRPLLNNVDKKQVLHKLLEERKEYYQQCHIEVAASNNLHKDTVDDIITELQKLILNNE